ncbi:hypothetical protein ZHAS_00021843 [Anopheles sinensis]|uniref:Uncharacterized protein n=1 Tax=Anopheles sinensis TaxID=74873 RepID=A0A084WTR0_ANOSI|nr:hypothetical protein ZHAS_00021843 [Anopheles sinensis]
MGNTCWDVQRAINYLRISPPSSDSGITTTTSVSLRGLSKKGGKYRSRCWRWWWLVQEQPGSRPSENLHPEESALVVCGRVVWFFAAGKLDPNRRPGIAAGIFGTLRLRHARPGKPSRARRDAPLPDREQ